MKRSRTIMSKLIGLGLLIVFCWSGIYLFQYAMDEYQMYKLEKKLDQDKHKVISEETGNADFTKLVELNDQSVGWITIDGTAIDYPVVQGDDNSYYLTHDFNNSSSIQGSIFMDYRNQPDFSDWNNIVYGHNMDNGSMFGALVKYRKQAFYEAGFDLASK